MHATFPLRFVTASSAALVAVALSGCATGGDEASESTSSVLPSVKPSTSYPSEDEILLEATEVLHRYNAIGDQLSSDYSMDASLLTPYAVEAEVDGYRAFQNRLETNGQRLIGTSTYRDIQLQEYDPALGRLVVLACSEFGTLRLVDSDGVDITPLDRADNATMQITLVITEEGPKVEKSVTWDGVGVC